MVDGVSPESAESVFIVVVAVSSWSVRAVASGESVALLLVVFVVKSARRDAGCALSAVVSVGPPSVAVACSPRAPCVGSVLGRLAGWANDVVENMVGIGPLALRAP